MKKETRIQDYIEHILDAIGQIESYTASLDQQKFESNRLVQDAVIRNFEIIGEAASKIMVADPTFTKRYPHLRLDLAYRMRNALIHGYDAVELVTVWNTVHNDLPTLRQQLANLPPT